MARRRWAHTSTHQRAWGKQKKHDDIQRKSNREIWTDVKATSEWDKEEGEKRECDFIFARSGHFFASLILSVSLHYEIIHPRRNTGKCTSNLHHKFCFKYNIHTSSSLLFTQRFVKGRHFFHCWLHVADIFFYFRLFSLCFLIRNSSICLLQQELASYPLLFKFKWTTQRTNERTVGGSLKLPPLFYNYQGPSSRLFTLNSSESLRMRLHSRANSLELNDN